MPSPGGKLMAVTDDLLADCRKALALLARAGGTPVDSADILTYSFRELDRLLSSGAPLPSAWKPALTGSS
jgi:hypothetical protein